MVTPWHHPVRLAVLGCCVLLARVAVSRAVENQPVNPAARSKPQVNLAEAIRLALANNPDIVAADQEVAISQAQHRLMISQALPSVHAVGGYTRYLDEQRLVAARSNGEPGVFTRDPVTADITLSVPLFSGLRVYHEVAASNLAWDASRNRVSRNRQELAFTVSSLFFAILAQRQFITSLESSSAALHAHVQQVVELIAAQKVARADRLRAEVRLADLLQKIERERNALAILTTVFANQLGGIDVEVTGVLEFRPAEQDPPLEQMVSQAFAAREDLRAARLLASAQSRNVDAAAARHLPTVALQASYGVRWAPLSSGRSAGVGAVEDVGRVGIVLDVPLFEGGRTMARVDEQRARLTAARERVRKLELQIRLEVETALLNVSSSHRRVLVTEQAVKQAGESLRIEALRYASGKGANADVLDAQAALLEAQSSHYKALADHNTALAQRKFALGAAP